MTIIGHEVRPVSTIDQVQDWMHNGSSQAFYLTGSRFFGNFHEGSDWDYFTDKSQWIADTLRDNDFFRIDITNHNYMDLNTAAVFEHTKVPIHIQLVDDVELKIAVQNMIKESHLLDHLMNKQQRKALWNACYQAYAYGRNRKSERTELRMPIPQLSSVGKMHFPEKINTIKHVRLWTGLGLKDTKDLVEALEAFMPDDPQAVYKEL